MPGSSVHRNDVAVAVGAVGIDTFLFTTLTEDIANRGWSVFDAPPVVVVALNVAALPALVFRRRRPVAVSVGLCVYAALLTLTVGSRPWVMLLVALYTATTLSPRRRGILCLFATLGAHAAVVGYEISAAEDDWVAAVGLVLLFVVVDVAVWALGRRVAHSHRARELAEAQAAMAAEAVTAERQRIARELHDIVAHAVTLMVLQASGARRQLKLDPELAGSALESVEVLGKQAMAELRRLLEVLRTVAGADESALESGETANLAHLNDLVRQTRAAGVKVTFSVQGMRGRFDPSVELTAYRIVQEALTNVTRHAGPGAHAEVSLSGTDGVMVIDVANDHAGTAPSVTAELSSGYGLIGLRERVKLMGGDMSTGPRPNGGYRLHVTLPAEPS